jgi:hypothetical protein
VFLDHSADEALVKKRPGVALGNQGIAAQLADDFSRDEVASRAGGLRDRDRGAFGVRGG